MTTVKHDSWWWGERFSGTRGALIAAGVAERSWFPTENLPSPRRKGDVQRTFERTVGGLKVVLTNYHPKNDRWVIKKYVSKEEQEARSAAEKEARRPVNDTAGAPASPNVLQFPSERIVRRHLQRRGDEGLPRRPDQDTIQVLSDLFRDAIAGRLRGIAYVALEDGDDFIADAAGEARNDVVRVRGMLRTLDDALGQLHHGRGGRDG